VASILKPFQVLNPRRSVPQGKLAIDWSHPLVQGLIGCWVPGSMGPIDLTGAVPDLIWEINVGSGGQPSLKSTPEGPGLDATKNSGFGNADFHGLAPSTFKTWSNLSVYWRGMIGPSADNPSAGTTLLGVAYDNAAGSPFTVFSLNINTSNVIGMDWNTASTINTVTGITPNFNAINSVGGTLPIGGTCNFYWNGVFRSSAAFGASPPQTSVTSTIGIGAYYPNKNQSNSITTICCAWNRILSAIEMALVDADPYGFLIPAEYELPALPAPSVAPIITMGATLPFMGVG
jgi:hypothetical protein